MNDQGSQGSAERTRGAIEERREILSIIERYMRQLAHGHGANGAQLLQQITDEIYRRGPV